VGGICHAASRKLAPARATLLCGSTVRLPVLTRRQACAGTRVTLHSYGLASNNPGGDPRRSLLFVQIPPRPRRTMNGRRLHVSRLLCKQLPAGVHPQVRQGREQWAWGVRAPWRVERQGCDAPRGNCSASKSANVHPEHFSGSATRGSLLGSFSAASTNTEMDSLPSITLRCGAISRTRVCTASKPVSFPNARASAAGVRARRPTHLAQLASGARFQGLAQLQPATGQRPRVGAVHLSLATSHEQAGGAGFGRAQDHYADPARHVVRMHASAVHDDGQRQGRKFCV
jgi:hypothetical protein